ncbi:MAG: hypothetical protein ACYTFG_22515, partial [Planctomycetota bacterium]
MRSTPLRLGVATAGALIFYVLGYAVMDADPLPAGTQTISVEVRDPETDPWVKEEMKRLEAERKEIERQKKAQAEAKKKLEENLAKIADRRKAVEENLEKVRERMEAMEPREEDLKTREEAMARLRETDVGGREAEAKALAKVLLEQQKEIKDKQESLEESQKSLSDSQTERDREWDRVRDEWKKLEAQRKSLEAKLTSAKTTAKEWEALKSEWKKLDAQKKKLEEAQEVRENVGRFKKQFDRGAFKKELARLKRTYDRKDVESKYVGFEFYFETSELKRKHLQFFGMKDWYLNRKTSKFVLKQDYRSFDFGAERRMNARESESILRDYSALSLNREADPFYTPYIYEAMKKIDGPRGSVIVRGLMPVNMVYEIVLHQQRVMEIFGLDRDDVLHFRFAPWFDRTDG